MKVQRTAQHFAFVYGFSLLMFSCLTTAATIPASPTAMEFECYLCDSQPNPLATSVPLSNSHCQDPFQTGIIGTTNCAGRCFAQSVNQQISGQESVTIVTRGCNQPDELCIEGCTDVVPEGAPPGTVVRMCRYCCDGPRCNTLNVEETALQQGQPTATGTRTCWQCEQVKDQATAGSCASRDFNGEGAQQEECGFSCLTATMPNDNGVIVVRRGCDPTQGQFCASPDVQCCTDELCNVGSAQDVGTVSDPDETQSPASPTAIEFECYSCDSQPNPLATSVPLSNSHCQDPFQTGIIGTTNCAGRCFAQSMNQQISGQESVTIVTRGCNQPEELCIEGCTDVVPEGAPPGTVVRMCRYCCDGPRCNTLNVEETALQQGPPTATGTRTCWQCEQVKDQATAGSCASRDFNGEGAQQEECSFSCLTATMPNDNGVIVVRRGCDPTQGQFCAAPDVQCCTDELCNVGSAEDDGTVSDPDGTQSPESTGCKSGWVQFQDKCYLLAHDERTNYLAAINYCRLYDGADLAIINDQAEQTFLAGLLIDDGSNVWHGYYIGLDDTDVEGVFKWRDGTPVEYTAWTAGEPNNIRNEDCVGMWPGGSGTWNDFPCDDPFAYSYICEQEAGKAAGHVSGTQTCWQCEQVKDQATTGSCASQDFNGEGAQQEECSFQCVTATMPNENGVVVVRRGCDPTQGQLCAAPDALCCSDELCNVGTAQDGGTVGDPDETPTQVPDIARCEAGWQHFQESCYFLEHDMRVSYDEAKRECSNNDAIVVTIGNSDEQVFLAGQLQGNNVGYLIGLDDSRREGSFEWLDGSAFTFANWGSGEPNNAGNEDCVGIPSGRTGAWNDYQCGGSYAYICEKKAAPECYTCDSQSNCNDPFNMEGMEKAVCNGRCFAQLSRQSGELGNVDVITRGCKSSEETCSRGCEEMASGEILCQYCCDDSLCNGMDILETASILEIELVEGDGTVVLGEDGTKTLKVNKNAGEVTLACKFTTAPSSSSTPTFTANGKEYPMTETIMGMEWTVSVDLVEEGTFVCATEDHVAEIFVDMFVDTFLELGHGKGTLSRTEDGNYDLKVLPGEMAAILCVPVEILDEYQWKRDSTVLYSSKIGVQMSKTDPDWERIRVEPKSPSKWDEAWWLIVHNVQESVVYTYTCSSPLYGGTTVNISASLNLKIETVEVEFKGEGLEYTETDQSVTIEYDSLTSASSPSSPTTSSENTTIGCTLYGKTPVDSVTWYRNNVQLMNPDVLMKEIKTGRTYELSLTRGFGIAGNYKCVADDGRERTFTVMVDVDAEIAPTTGLTVVTGKFFRGTRGGVSTLTAYKGRDISLTCRSDNIPSNATFKWVRSPLGEERFTELSADGDIDLELSHNLVEKEWTVILKEIPEENAGIYACEVYDGDGGHRVGRDTVYVTVFDAPKDVIRISLTTHEDGVTRELEPTETEILVNQGAMITLTCHSYFWADEIMWHTGYHDDRVTESIYGRRHTLVETIPRWETTVTFEKLGGYGSEEEDYTCRTSVTGRRAEREITLLTVVPTNITIGSNSRSKLIETPEEKLITLNSGDELSLICTALTDFEKEKLAWRIGRFSVTAKDADFSWHLTFPGRLSITYDEAAGTSTMLLNDIEDDEKMIGCTVSGNVGSNARVVVVDEMDACENECYSGTGAWEGNCFTNDEMCNGDIYCPNLVDEYSCPEIGCSGLTSPDNGRITATSFAFGRVVNFNCNNGYTLHGSESRQCQDDGQWTGEETSCKLNIESTTCPRLSSPSGGTGGQVFNMGNAVGDINYFKCNDEYVIGSGDSSRTCQSTGDWTGMQPRCGYYGANPPDSPTILRLTRGRGTTRDVLYCSASGSYCYNMTIITVFNNTGSITISCQFPEAMAWGDTGPIWWPQIPGGSGSVYDREEPEPYIGEHSTTEIIERTEFRLTMGISGDGPLQPGTQTPVMLCTSVVFKHNKAGRFRIDVVDQCRYGSQVESTDIDWSAIGDYCYVLIKERTTFHSAKERCVELGATLSSIHNDDEQQIHLNWMTELGVKRAWIGINDEAQEGEFENADESPNDFQYWGKKEPKDSTGEEDCAHLKRDEDGKWKAVPCTETMSFFCKTKKYDETADKEIEGKPSEQEDNSTVGVTGGEEQCSIPRRYDVTYLGKDCHFRGWVDVQGQGASNDYCRVVSTGGQMNYLSCALAGTEGQSEYNYNSPNPGDVFFEIGYDDTWYMKDEDGDGKDDYCRCVGKVDTYVSCMKAGDTGFNGFYDFNVTAKASPCDTIKVNPLFGI